MKKKFAEHYGDDCSEAEGVTPLVHAQETTDQSSFKSSYREFLVSGQKKDVDFADDVYAAIDVRDESKRTATLRLCRTNAWFVRHKVTGHVRITSSRCGLRWCPLCIKTKRFVMQESLKPWVRRANRPKFITLTLKHTEAPLSHQIDSLYKFFKSLRRRPYWKRRITGGVWFFQVKKSNNDGLWHPHLHVICEGRYLPREELSDMWFNITHGSSVVDIRAVNDHKKAVEYTARYASAPCRLSDLDMEDAIEVVDSMHGRRICGTFGTAKVVQLVPKKCPDAEEWEYLGGFWEIMQKRHTCEFSQEVWSAFVAERFCYAWEPPPMDESRYTLLPESEEPVRWSQLKFEFEGKL